MKVVKVKLMGIILCISIIFNVENLAGLLDSHSEEVVKKQPNWTLSNMKKSIF